MFSSDKPKILDKLKNITSADGLCVSYTVVWNKEQALSWHVLLSDFHSLQEHLPAISYALVYFSLSCKDM